MTEPTQYKVICKGQPNGDIIVPIPPELLTQLGWKQGDKIEFLKDDAGRIILRKIRE